jgi:hypothetical protein
MSKDLIRNFEQDTRDRIERIRKMRSKVRKILEGKCTQRVTVDEKSYRVGDSVPVPHGLWVKIMNLDPVEDELREFGDSGLVGDDDAPGSARLKILGFVECKDHRVKALVRLVSAKSTEGSRCPIGTIFFWEV